MYKKLPYKVVINEVVELAKLYGDENAPSFINGVLGNIVKKNKRYLEYIPRIKADTVTDEYYLH